MTRNSHSTRLSPWERVLESVTANVVRGNSGQPFAAASIKAFAVYVVGAALSYLTQLVIARTIGAESFGIYAYVLAWMTLLGYLSTLGFHVSLLRFVPTYRAKQHWPLVRGVIRYSQQRAACVGIAIILVGAWAIFALEGFIRPELATTFLFGIAAVPVIALHLISASVARAFGGVVTALAPERIVRDCASLVIMAVASWSNLVRPDARLAIVASLVSALVTLALLRIAMRRLRPPELEHETPEFAAKEWWRPTFPLMGITVADNVMSRSGVILLGLSGNTRHAGVFAVAFSMALLTALPRMAVGAIFAPRVSDLFARGDRPGLQTLLGRAACLSLVGTAGAALPLVLIASPLLSWFGRDFVEGAPIVTILVLGQLFAAACGPQQHLITMTAHEQMGAAILAGSAALNLAACLLMIGPLGMTGAALAMTGSLIVWNVAMGVFNYRRLHLVPGLVASFRHFYPQCEGDPPRALQARSASGSAPSQKSLTGVE